jgi:adenylyltransferase/sulfurtransferase
VSASVVVVGAGNIGSHLIPHLGRMGLRRVRVIDPDTYEGGNLQNQDIRRDDVGRPKAIVQAERLRCVDPALDVSAIPDAVENVPLGLLRADVVLACLDSRAARRTVNAAAWRLGVPWVDAGVLGEELLARVNVYRPGHGEPCAECAWDDATYAALEQVYPCADRVAARPTNAPSSLGALAAALQALECRKVLAGQWDVAAVGRQVTVSALAHRHYVTRFVVNARCRFDHEILDVERIDRHPAAITLAGAFAVGRELSGPLRLRVAQQVFARTLRCLACGQAKDLGLRLLGRLRASERACAACGEPTQAAGWDVREWLPAAGLPAAVEQGSLRRLGVHRGDVLTVAGSAGAVHVQIGDEEAR